MNLQELDPKFGQPTAHPAIVLLERVRKRAEHETVRTLVQFAYYGHAQELIAELEAALAGIEAEIAELEARAALASREAAEADKRFNEANRTAHRADGRVEREAAARERQLAVNERAAARSAMGKANRKAAELRQPLPGMRSFLRELQTVQPPDLGPLAGLRDMLAGNGQDDTPARRRGRKKRGAG